MYIVQHGCADKPYLGRNGRKGAGPASSNIMMLSVKPPYRMTYDVCGWKTPVNCGYTALRTVIQYARRALLGKYEEIARTQLSTIRPQMGAKMT